MQSKVMEDTDFVRQGSNDSDQEEARKRIASMSDDERKDPFNSLSQVTAQVREEREVAEGTETWSEKFQKYIRADGKLEVLHDELEEWVLVDDPDVDAGFAKSLHDSWTAEVE